MKGSESGHCQVAFFFLSGEKSCLPIGEHPAGPLSPQHEEPPSVNLWATAGVSGGGLLLCSLFALPTSKYTPLPRSVPAELSTRRTSSKFTPSSFLKEVRGLQSQEMQLSISRLSWGEGFGRVWEAPGTGEEDLSCLPTFVPQTPVLMPLFSSMPLTLIMMALSVLR